MDNKIKSPNGLQQLQQIQLNQMKKEKEMDNHRRKQEIEAPPNHRRKVEIGDTPMEYIVKISEGNPGCLTFLMELMSKSKHLSWVFGPMSYIQALDNMGVYGSKAYMLWNDCCNRDIEQVELVFHNYLRCELSDKEIHENLDRPRGSPFENLKSFKELELLERS